MTRDSIKMCTSVRYSNQLILCFDIFIGLAIRERLWESAIQNCPLFLSAIKSFWYQDFLWSSAILLRAVRYSGVRYWRTLRVSLNSVLRNDGKKIEKIGKFQKRMEVWKMWGNVPLFLWKSAFHLYRESTRNLQPDQSTQDLLVNLEPDRCAYDEIVY